MLPYHEKVVPLRASVPLAPTQGTLALDLEPRHAPPRGRAPQGRPIGADVVPIDVRVRRETDDWTRRFAQAAVEIVGGDRPSSQLLRWTSREVYLDLERRAVLVARAGGHVPGAGRVQGVRARVCSVRTCAVAPGIIEAGIHVRYGERSRALAARFEQRSARWVCTALEFA